VLREGIEWVDRLNQLQAPHAYVPLLADDDVVVAMPSGVAISTICCVIEIR